MNKGNFSWLSILGIGILLHYIIAVLVFAFVNIELNFDISIWLGGFLLLAGFYLYRLAKTKINYFNSVDYQKPKDDDLIKKVNKQAKEILNNIQWKYWHIDEELTEKLYKIFESNLLKAPKESIKKDFWSDRDIQIWIYSILSTIIIEDLYRWNNNSPLWKFEYYRFLLFNFLDKLLELWYYENEEEIYDFLKDINIDYLQSFVNLWSEREKYLDKNLKSEQIIPKQEKDDDDEDESEENDLSKYRYHEYDVYLNWDYWYYEENWVEDEMWYLEQLTEEKKYEEVIELFSDVSQDFIKYIEESHFSYEDYILPLAIAYQETWNLNKADKYFNKYINRAVIWEDIVKEWKKKWMYHIDNLKLLDLIDTLNFKFNIDYKGSKKFIKEWSNKK